MLHRSGFLFVDFRSSAEYTKGQAREIACTWLRCANPKQLPKELQKRQQSDDPLKGMSFEDALSNQDTRRGFLHYAHFMSSQRPSRARPTFLTSKELMRI